MIFCNIRTDFNLIFGKFSVARKLILNGGAIRPIGLLFKSMSWFITSKAFDRSHNTANVYSGIFVLGVFCTMIQKMYIGCMVEWFDLNPYS